MGRWDERMGSHDSCYDSARVREVSKFRQVDAWRCSWFKPSGSGRKRKQTLPCTKVKLSVGDWNGNR